MRAAERCFSLITLHALGPQIHKQDVRIRPIGHCCQTTFVQLIRHGLRVANDLLDIAFEFRPLRLTKGYSLGRNHMHQRTALNAGEDGRVELLGQCLVIGQDHPAAWAAQSLVRGGRGRMGMGERAGIFTSCDQACEMRHIDEQIGPHAVRNLSEPRKVDLARNRGSTGDDHLWLVLSRQGRDLIIVNVERIAAHAVLYRIEPLARLIGFGPMG